MRLPASPRYTIEKRRLRHVLQAGTGADPGLRRGPAKRFYLEQAGFELIVDTPIGEGMRVVQLNPPGSACLADPDGNAWVLQEVAR